ncbi:coiled-coil domain-containing protein 9B-like isoform X3 [Salvelinus alpinus]|uniref:coiled-coil domain-containing protein 9B-like isoform X3 n=1 Tax=Salvelinus alpinus TaxID=8036 RepID=UPI0039FBDA6E
MHDPECSAILELHSKESSEESSEEDIVKCSAEPEVVGPANAAMELERRIEEMRRRNEALLKRFNEVEEDRRRAERRGAALLPKSTKLVKTSYSAHTTDVSDQWESLSITVMNQDSRLVARRSNGGSRQPKSRRLEDRLEKRCGEEKNILEERQLIICTIDNGCRRLLHRPQWQHIGRREARVPTLEEETQPLDCGTARPTPGRSGRTPTEQQGSDGTARPGRPVSTPPEQQGADGTAQPGRPGSTPPEQQGAA